MMNLLFALFLITAVFAKPPNILIFNADDLGYGDVGCFGNTTLRTPNIDKLATQGAKLTHHLTSSAMCTPSRSSLLTGRYPSRTGMVPPTFVPVILFVASSSGLPQSEVTIAELAKTKGYNTGLIGKWHLGWSESKYNDNVHHPLNQGFDYYFGHPLTNMKDWYGDGESVLMSQNPTIYWQAFGSLIAQLIISYFLLKKGYVGYKFIFITFLLPCLVWSYTLFTMGNMLLLNSVLYRNFDLVEQPVILETLSDRITKESIEFIENSKKNSQPFLLVVSWDHVHTALITAKQFRGKSKHGRYGDAVEELDFDTGRILSTLDELGLAEHTFVYFTSDNGGHLEEFGINGEVDGGYNGILKGGKGHPSVDGGIRVPSIVRFPNQIPSKTEISVPTTQMDMFTTIANIIQSDIPKDRVIDGRDIMPILKQTEHASPHQFLYHYCNSEVQAMRYMDPDGDKVWKLVFKEPDYIPGQTTCATLVCSCNNAVKLDPPVFYEVTSDPGEKIPIQIESDNKLKNIANIMMQALEAHKQSVGSLNSQMTIPKLLWNPLLQPCCNFPYCKCTDPKYS